MVAVSERRACQVLGQARSTQRYRVCAPNDEAALTAAIVRLATRFGRYGYRRITALLRAEGWVVNHKRVERIWRREGLKVPRRHPKRGRLWLTDGSCVRLRPAPRHHVWADDFVAARTHDGRPLRLLTVVDAYTRPCLAIKVARHIRADDVLHCLTRLMVAHGVPAHLRADHGPEFTNRAVRTWLGRVGTRPLFIEPGSPWEHGYIERFNGKLRDELLDGEIFDTLRAAHVLIESWRRTYTHIRPHSSLGQRPPAPAAILPAPAWLTTPPTTSPTTEVLIARLT